jgi:hypothetical protein
VTKPEPTFLVTPAILDLFVRALVNEVDYDIHKGYECGEEDGLDHYPELVATAAEQLAAITTAQADDDEFTTTLNGGHALIVEYGDCEFYGTCQCGTTFGMVTPDRFGEDVFGSAWERHVSTEVSS